MKCVSRRGISFQPGRCSVETLSPVAARITVARTANHYTNPKLLDVHGALPQLPQLPLDAERPRTAATGTCGDSCVLKLPQFALQFVGNRCKPGQNVAIPGKGEDAARSMHCGDLLAVTSSPVNEKGPLTAVVSGPCESGRPDSNRRRPAWETNFLANAITTKARGRLTSYAIKSRWQGVVERRVGLRPFATVRGTCAVPHCDNSTRLLLQLSPAAPRLCCRR